jgi:aldose 1-epimerase
LFNPATGNGFSIVPDKGANVLSIQFAGREILDGHATPEALEEGKWGKSTVLFPFPNRLRDGRYTWLGHEYHFPLNNAATGNAIHGFARDHAFTVDKIELLPDAATFTCDLHSTGHPTGYPFRFVLQLKFTITDRQLFTLEVACRNLHDHAIPVGFGWHPYFRLADRADVHFLQLPPARRVEIDDRMIPTGADTAYAVFGEKKQVEDTFLDTCFRATGKGNYHLRLSGTDQKTLRVTSTAAHCPFFQVFTPPHRQSIALEPMSCNVNAFNSGDGLVALQPHKTWKIAMEVALFD